VQKLHNRSTDDALEQRLTDILNELYGFYSQKIDMSLERVERFLHQLGDPHLNLPPVVHIAGTNGKGSTLATLRSLLEAQGKTVHVMTSPHLVHPTERIRIAGELISTEYLIALLEECLAVNRSEPITFFEIFTAATYLAFSRHKADICLLETGMGGRLDATNVVPNPICTIITTISKDHEKFLGDTLPKIAFEKAGIMKASAPCVIGYQTQNAIDDGVLEVFQKQSKALSPEAPLFIQDKEWFIEPNNDGMHYQSGAIDMTLNRPNLLGDHQVYNAGAAITAFDVINETMNWNLELSQDAINKALGTIHWPGRLQKIDHSALDQNWILYLDGGHNDSAGASLGTQAAKWQYETGQDLHLIVAMVDRKNPAEFLRPLLPFTKSLTLMEISGEETSYDLNTLHEIASDLGFKNNSVASDFDSAVETIVQNNASGRILATGSLYFLGNILGDQA